MMGWRNVGQPAELQVPGSIVDLPNGAQRLRRASESSLELIQSIAPRNTTAQMQRAHAVGLQANDCVPYQPRGETATALAARIDMVFGRVSCNAEDGHRFDGIGDARYRFEQ